LWAAIRPWSLRSAWENGAYIGAGSCITKDVPAGGSLAAKTSPPLDKKQRVDLASLKIGDREKRLGVVKLTCRNI
jgi:hypothetical protein